MNSAGPGFRTVVGAMLLWSLAAVAQRPVSTPAGPVPPALQAARKIFISNAGSDSGLFPSPFSGTQNRAYAQFHAALKATGAYDLVPDPADADLVLELRLTGQTGPPGAQNSPMLPQTYRQYQPLFRLVIFDRKTHYILWAMTESIDSAALQRTHDRNFDEALNDLVLDFEELTGKKVPDPRLTP